MSTQQPIQYLNGERIYLRPLESADVDRMHALANGSAEMRRLTGTQRAFTRAHMEAYIHRIGQDESRVQFGIVVQETHQLIGDVAIMDIDPTNRNGSFRIAIMDEDAIGKGYGTEATRLMLDYGFGMRNLHRIELDVYTINPRAIHVYEKLGFRREGVKREEHYYQHQYYDTVMMAILEHEYRQWKQNHE